MSDANRRETRAMMQMQEWRARAAAAEARVAALEGALRGAFAVFNKILSLSANSELHPESYHDRIIDCCCGAQDAIRATLTAPAPANREACWLIERHDIGERAKYYFELYKGRHGWTTDVHSAHKFASKADAVAVVGNATDLHVREHVFGLGLPPAPATGGE